MKTEVRKIEITTEAIIKYKRTTLSDALLQPLFNSVDANASQIIITAHNEKDKQMQLFADESESPAYIVVEDNGSGIPFEKIGDYFQQFEKSWKAGCKPEHRASYHGSKGCGRFKCFALGRKLEWVTTYRDKKGKLRTYSMRLEEDSATDLVIGAEHKASKSNTGTVLKISALTQRMMSQMYEKGIKKLMFEILNAMILDLELTPKVEVNFFGEILDTNQYKAVDETFPIDFAGPDGTPAHGDMRLISWKQDMQFVDHKHAFLYKSTGEFLAQHASGTPADSRFPPHTLIITTDAYDSYSDLEVEFKSWYASIDRATQARVIAILTSAKEKEFAKTLKGLIQSKDYPFKSAPRNILESAQQDAYNSILASLAFDNSSAITPHKPQILKVVFPLLERLFKGDYLLSESVGRIVDLKDEDAERFNRMVTRIRLSKLLSRYSELIRRKEFLQTLQLLVHVDKHSRYLRERTQLHKIVAEEVWIFGDEFEQEHLLTSDKAITTLLRENAKRNDLLFEFADDGNLDKVDQFIKENVGNLDSCLQKIPDLALCRTRSQSGAQTRDYLVIELKKPMVKIDGKCREQALDVYTGISYAAKHGGGLSIDPEHRWRYYLVSSEMDKSLKSDFTSQGCLVEKESGNYVIKVMLWKDIFEKANARIDKELHGIEIDIQDEDCQRLLASFKKRYKVV